MAVDAATVARFRGLLGGAPGVTEQPMMGGVCFLLHGNMIGGANLKDGKPRYMFRVGKTNIDAAAELPHGEPTVMGSRPMPGFFFVDGSAASDDELARWLGLALSFVSALPPKPC